MSQSAVDYTGTRFLSTSQTNAFANRLNARCEMLLTRHRNAIADKRVLDLASHDGRFSRACLELGAAHVTGIEGRPELVDNAIENLRVAGYSTDRFTMMTGGVLDHLPRYEVAQFDTILCFGFFYHTYRHIELLREIERLGPEHFIIDTTVYRPAWVLRLYRATRRSRPHHLLPGHLRMLADSLDDESLVFVHEDPKNEALTVDPTGFVGLPTRPLVSALLRLHGFQPEEIVWRGTKRDWTQLSDYKRGNRVSFFCTRCQ